MENSSLQDISISNIDIIICVAGNDGTGKSTICQKINSEIRKNSSNIYCIERSHRTCPKDFLPLLNQLKTLDLLTYNYSFQKQRSQFEKINHLQLQIIGQNGQVSKNNIKVFWFLLDLQPEKIQNRLFSRKIVDKYDSKKAVQYYSHIYRQFSWYYGIPNIYADQPSNQIIFRMLSMIESGSYNNISSLAFKSINLQFIQHKNIENTIYKKLKNQLQNLDKVWQNVKVDIDKSQIIDLYSSSQQFKELFQQNKNVQEQKLQQFKLKLASRYLIKNSCIQYDQNGNISLKYKDLIKNQQSQILNVNQSIPNQFYFKIIQQGQSKILLTIHSNKKDVEAYFNKKVVILLKSTIYSHTKQHTGQISNLSKVRALGNILFLQMIRRNNLKHSYICINHENGMILSQFVETNQLEVVFKRQCLGTDKYSYHNLNKLPTIVNQQNNNYCSGVYIRFDWRNPNHVMLKYPNLVINQNAYYYVIQKFFGKQIFFKNFLSNQQIIKPIGDKCISQDVIINYFPVKSVKKSALRLYSSFQYYSKKVGLQILDGCFMFDKSGEIGWSQINPDCMRVKSIKNKQDYDKDIWRYGGSSKKQEILQKWTVFNNIFIQWFKLNRFHQTQMLQMPQLCYPYQQICRQILENNSQISNQYKFYYRQLSTPKWDKKIIGTIDISQGKPILVKSSQITESHSLSLQKAYQHINLLQNIVLVDIDAAIYKKQQQKIVIINQVGNNSNLNLQNKQVNNNFNRLSISNLVQKDRNKVYAVGGGIRSRQILQFYLNQVKCKKVILSSCLELLQFLKPQDIRSKIIVELSINQKNQVLIKGRSQNTQINIIKKIQQLIQFGVSNISITFNHRQGHLKGIPRKQLIQIYSQIPTCIENIIIAGGISSIDDLNFIWGFKRCIPQLGSAIWKNKILISQIYKSLIKFNFEGLIPTIIIDKYKNILGQIYLDQKALILTCQTRQLWRYSRQHKKMMRKGQTSNNILDVKKLKLDCDNDSLIIQVQRSCQNKIQNSKHFRFCHKNQESCFQQTLDKKDILALQHHIMQKKVNGSGYSKRMINNQGLAAMKIIEQVQQLHVSQNNKVRQAADLMAHLLMYFNSHEISFNQVLLQLQKRSIDTIKIKNNNQLNTSQQKSKLLDIGIISGKHFDRIDKLTQKMLGLKLIRAKNRSAKIQYQIVNHQLFLKMFGNQQLNLIGIKSKDMSSVISKKIVKKCINYSIMMQNYPTVSTLITKELTPGIYLGLLGRKDEQVNPKEWTSKNKGIIVCQYPFSVNKYFRQMGIQQSCYSLIRVSGGTQSYLVSNQRSRVDFCDAIVESGKTIEDNGLQVIAVLQQNIYAGYYQSL